jgi:hypothetical protein
LGASFDFIDWGTGFFGRVIPVFDDHESENSRSCCDTLDERAGTQASIFTDIKWDSNDEFACK